jgi:hypothetical protein
VLQPAGQPVGRIFFGRDCGRFGFGTHDTVSPCQRRRPPGHKKTADPVRLIGGWFNFGLFKKLQVNLPQTSQPKK